MCWVVSSYKESRGILVSTFYKQLCVTHASVYTVCMYILVYVGYVHMHTCLSCVSANQMQYSKTPTHKMCTKLDLPPVSSAIIWARQVIEIQIVSLNTVLDQCSLW